MLMKVSSAVGGLKMHATPASHSKVIDSLAPGDLIEVNERGVHWTRGRLVKRADGNPVGIGESGWCFDKYLEAVPEPKAPEPEPRVPQPDEPPVVTGVAVDVGFSWWWLVVIGGALGTVAVLMHHFFR